MFEGNINEVLRRIGPEDLVLDVGGWARCFNRADYVIDKFPCETRGVRYGDRLGLHAQGGETERFSSATWVARDLCNREPWPFPDQFFDFCTCSHTLEDLRDPIWVCSEMRRVAKAGYIETPSMAFELTRGREANVPVGLSHHFWVVEVEGSTITFHPKLHNLHGDLQLSLSPSVGATLPPERLVTWLFWERDFSVQEGWLHRETVERFVQKFGPSSETQASSASQIEADARVFELTRAYEEARSQIWDLRARLEHAEEQWQASQASLQVREQQIEHALSVLHATSADRDAAIARLAPLEGIGPTPLRLAHRLHRLAERHPNLRRLLKRVVRSA